MVGYERDWFWWVFQAIHMSAQQCLSQDLKTRCLEMADFVKSLGVQIFKGPEYIVKGDHNILIFQP